MNAHLQRWLPAILALVLAIPAAMAFTGWLVWPAVALALVAGERLGRFLVRRMTPLDEGTTTPAPAAPGGSNPAGTLGMDDLNGRQGGERSV